ncbi:MAG: BMP family ABC transporter substrate-binding protein [Deltaproteobacteria bacterium]|nr:BMP family ABC transporter substrate-binding protein [Deltaproteobacteria bacterium]
MFLVLALALSCSAALAADAAKEIKIGFVYVSPVGDAGWSYSHDLARQELEKHSDISTYYMESVPEGADSERVILSMARKGYDLIFTTSFGYMDPTLKVAKQFPKTAFMHASGYKTSENVGNYFGRIYQSRYLTGMVAGLMTKKNQIGYVAAFPIPEVVRGINAFTLGVRAVNPKAEVRVVWTKTWYDPALEKDAAISLLDIGVDVIAQHQDSPGPQEAAQDRGAYSVGYHSDMSRFAPEAHLVAAVWNWVPFYLEAVDQVRKGTWQPKSDWPGMESGIVDISPYGKMVPEDVRATVDQRKQEIVDGKYVVFSGPINDQSGKLRVEPGKVLSDQELISFDWFVDGVVGTMN